MVVLKGLMILNLGYISYQDIKDREVYWFLFPILMLTLGLLHYRHVLLIHFFTTILINLSVIGSIMGMLFFYNMLKLKRSFFKDVFGFGDLLFFIAFALAFPTVTFIILFVFSLFFSLGIWMVFKNKSTHTNVPLAGYMSLFLILVFCIDNLIYPINLYLI